MLLPTCFAARSHFFRQNCIDFVLMLTVMVFRVFIWYLEIDTFIFSYCGWLGLRL